MAKEQFQEELDALVLRAKEANCIIRCIWIDEYGGPQSIELNNTDHLIIEHKEDPVQKIRELSGNTSLPSGEELARISGGKHVG